MKLSEKLRDELIEAYSDLKEDRDRLRGHHARLRDLVTELAYDISSIDDRLSALERFFEENELGVDDDNEVVAFKKGASA